MVLQACCRCATIELDATAGRIRDGKQVRPSSPVRHVASNPMLPYAYTNARRQVPENERRLANILYTSSVLPVVRSTLLK